MDVVYSDPKDSKLYQVPGADPRPETEADVLYKVYVSSGREAQYCRPYITMKHPPPTQTPGRKTLIQLVLFKRGFVHSKVRFEDVPQCTDMENDQFLSGAKFCLRISKF